MGWKCPVRSKKWKTKRNTSHQDLVEIQSMRGGVGRGERASQRGQDGISTQSDAVKCLGDTGHCGRDIETITKRPVIVPGYHEVKS